MVSVDIIGGGIGGLTFANALNLAGIDFNLFEQAPKLTEVGAAIGISKVPLDILETLGLAQQVKDMGSVIHQINITDKNLNVIRAISPEWPSVIIHRAKLIDVLASKLPVEKIHLTRKLTQIKSESVFSVLKFSDGFETQSGCTVIADGINSFVRKQIFPEIKIRYSQQTIWRGITTMQLPQEYSNTYTEIWDSSKRFLFAPMDAKNVCWLAVKNADVGERDNPNTLCNDLLKEYANFHPLVKELLLKSSNFIRNDLADLGNRHRLWHHNKIVFLGDSIHATTPNLAQGACQAMEDGFCLSLLMKKSNGDLQKIFRTYQKLRNKKVSFVVNTSWQLGRMTHSQLLSHFIKSIFRYAPTSLFLGIERKLNDNTYLPRDERQCCE